MVYWVQTDHFGALSTNFGEFTFRNCPKRVMSNAPTPYFACVQRTKRTENYSVLVSHQATSSGPVRGFSDSFWAKFAETPFS
jgi:hypothetical protein